jgi:hypothetical protein
MILHWLLIDYCIYRLNVFMISGNGVNPTTGEQWWQWWQHMTVECAYILLFDFQLKAIMRVLDWIYSQSCTRRYDLKSAKRFYEQPVQEPVQGCLWKTVAATCSNNVVSSSCVMLPYPWSSLDVGYWIGCELEEYKLNTYSCALGVPPKTYALDLSFRNVLKVRSQDGHFCRYGQTWSTWINDYRPELPYGLACCRRKKGAMVLRCFEESCGILDQGRAHQAHHKIPESSESLLENSGWKLEAILPKDLLVGWWSIAVACLSHKTRGMGLSRTTCFVQSIAWTSEADNYIPVLYIAVPRSCR